MATYYFTKWVKVIPTKFANENVVIEFLESNILSHFGCPRKIITDNAPDFKSKKMVASCEKYNITLGNSIPYYPQGNGLVKSSNKSLVSIIKKLLQENKKSWYNKLTLALWADRVSTKRALGMSPFKVVYGTNAVFPSSLGNPVMNLLQEEESEPNHAQRRIYQMIHLQKTREELYSKT